MSTAALLSQPTKMHGTEASSQSANARLALNVHNSWLAFPGRTGIAIVAGDGEMLASERGAELFPQQSVSKLWVALRILTLNEKGQLPLKRSITVTRDDLVVFNQPLRKYLGSNGHFEMTVAELLEHAITASDNLANNVLLRVGGGPKAINRTIADYDLGAIRFGPGEPLLQSKIAGLDWQTEYREARNFEAARARLPMGTRKEALAAYLADPIDGARPEAIARALYKFANSKKGTAGPALLDIMRRTFTGRTRLLAGLEPGWTIAHKTGTGQKLGNISTGINDVGMLTAPDGCRYFVAVMLADTTADRKGVGGLMAAISKAVIRHHGELPQDNHVKSGTPRS
jgi:beta-lactamase class A